MKTVLQVSGDQHIDQQSIEDIAQGIIDNCDPVFAYGLAKMLTHAAKKVEAQVKDKVLEVIESSGAKSVEVGDAMFTYANWRSAYDYSDNHEWLDVSNQIECLTEDRKEIEKKLKALGQCIETKSPATVRVKFR